MTSDNHYTSRKKSMGQTKICPFCRAENDISAVQCSNCGKTPDNAESPVIRTVKSIFKGIYLLVVELPLTIIIVGIVILAIVTIAEEVVSPNKKNHETPNYQAPQNGSPTNVPSYINQPPQKPLSAQSQTTFEKQLSDYAIKYQTQVNEIKKSAVYTKAISWQQQFLSNKRFSDWKGTVIEISTPKGGDSAIIVIQSCSPIPKEYTERSATNRGDVVELRASRFTQDEFCVSYGDEVEKNSAAYSQAGELQVGTDVVFSGEFDKGDERSFTEKGAMNSPEFKMELYSIHSK